MIFKKKYQVRVNDNATRSKNFWTLCDARLHANRFPGYSEIFVYNRKLRAYIDVP